MNKIHTTKRTKLTNVKCDREVNTQIKNEQ